MKYVFSMIALALLPTLALAADTAKPSPTPSNSGEITLSKDNTIKMNAVVDGDSVSKAISEARALDANLKSGYPIVLFLDTPGGSIQAGLELIESLRALNRPVNTVTLFAASMGFQIVQHLGDRAILSYGTLMSHKAFGGFRAEFGGDIASQFDNRYGFWLRRLTLMDEQTVRRTGGKQTLKSYRASYENELWQNGQEAVDNGYADRVVTAKCDSSLSGTHDDVYNFDGFSVTISWSDCPLITDPVAIKMSVHTNVGILALDAFIAKGGLMGTDCPPYENSYYNRNDTNVQPKQSVVCALNKNLTVDKINEEVKKIKQKYSVEVRKREAVLTF